MPSPQDEACDPLEEQLRVARAALEGSRQAAQGTAKQAERSRLLRQIDVLSHLVLMHPQM